VLLGIRKSKVPVDVGLEDALTAATLGSLRYLPAAICLQWLANARDRNRRPLDLDERCASALADSIDLWPSFDLDGVTVEPDAILDLPDRCIILEAKLWSGKSQTEPEVNEDGAVGDQLAREWVAVRCAREKRGLIPVDPLIVFVTAHVLFPNEDVIESELALAKAGHEGTRVFWVGWSALARVLRANRSRLSREQVVLVDDVLVYMHRALPSGAMPFDGWTIDAPDAPDAAKAMWRYFAPRRARFEIDASPIGSWWRYSRPGPFTLAVEIGDQTACVWRYQKGNR
jgi:hypothetical protein